MPASIADHSPASQSPASKAAVMLLERKLLDLAFGKVKFSVISALLLASSIVTALWSVIEHQRLLAWLAGIAGVKVLHILYLHRYKRHGNRADVDPNKWKAGLVAGAAATGLGWGSAVFCFPSTPFNPLTLFGVFVLPSTPFDPVTVLLIFTLAGVTAYASVALAFVPLAAFAFFACAWLPLAIWLFSFGEQMYVVMGLIALSYLGVMVMLSRRMHATVRSLISVSEENRGLRTAQQENDWRMQRFFESAPGFFYTACMTPDGKSFMPFASAGIVELFDVAAEAVTDSMSPLFAVVNMEDIERIIKAREASRRNLSPFWIEFRVNHRIRGERWIELNSMPQREPDGTTNWHGFMQDITERKRVEAEISGHRDHLEELVRQRTVEVREQEALLRALVDNLPFEFFAMDANLAYTMQNAVSIRNYGPVVGKRLEELGLPDEVLAAWVEQNRSVLGGKTQHAEYEKEVDGENRIYESLVAPVKTGGIIIGLVGVGMDITERKQAEAHIRTLNAELEQRVADRTSQLEAANRDLRESEQRFSSLAGNMPDNIARFDTEGRYLYINPTHERLLGRKLEDLIGLPIPDSHAHVKAGVALVAGTGQAIHAVRQSVMIGDVEELHDVSLVPEFDETGKVVSVLGIGRDMTERYRMQETIAAREQEFRSLVESTPDFIVRYDREGRHRYLNPPLLRNLGLGSTDEVIGKRPSETWPDGRFDQIEQAAARAVETGDLQLFEMIAPGENGELNYGQIFVVPERDVHGGIVGTIAFGRDITAIREAERKLSHFVDSLPGMAYTFRLAPDGTMAFTYVSRAVEAIYGLTEEEAKKGDFHAVHAIVPEEDRERIETAIVKSARDLSQKFVEFRIRRPGQPERWVYARSQPERQADGGVIWFGILLDITERKHMEVQIAQERATLRAFFGTMPALAWMKDAEGRYLACNPLFEQFFGATEAEIVGKTDADFVEAELASFFRQKDKEAEVAGKPSVNEEWVTFASDGRRALLETVKSPVLDAEGRVIGIIGVAHDITGRKRMEMELQDSRNFLEKIIDGISDPIFVKDREHRWVLLNEAFSNMTGYPREELLGKSDYEFFPKEEADAFRQGDERMFASGKSYASEDSITYGNGEIRAIHTVKSPFFAQDGQVFLVGVIRDITERKRMENALRTSEEKIRSLYELSPLGIALTDMQGRYVEFNEAFRALCGYPADELATLDYWTLTPREFEAMEAEQLESLAKTGRYGPYEKEYRQKDGTLIPVQLSGVRFTGQDGKQYIWSIVEDVTERKRTEALMKEKLERIVELNDYLEESSRTMEEHAVELEASQEQLKEALEFSNGVINAIPDILFEMDREGRYHGIWTQKPKLLAAQKALLLNKTLHEVLLPETADIALAAIREADEDGFSYGNVIDIALPSGEIRWFELSISRKQGGSPSDTRFIVLSRDVTERQRTEDALRFIAQGEWMQSGESFLDTLVRYLGKSLGVDYVVIDKFADEPGYVETVARYAKGEIVQNVRYALQSTPCGEVAAGAECCHGENIQGRFPEARLLKDMRVESYVGIPLLNIEGAVIGLIAVLHEQPLGGTHFVKSILQMVASSVTAELTRSRMEQVLRENFDALNEAQRISHIGNWELDLANGALLWSDEIYRIFEIDPERFGASYDAFIDVIHPDDREMVNCAYSESLASREPYEIEHRLLFADGRIKYVHERCETRYDDEGKPLRSLGTVQDITARKRAEESLRESYEKISELNRHLENNAVHLEENARHLEEQTIELEASQEQLKQTEAWYRSILHSAPEGMLVVDDHGLIMQVNARLEAMFGYGSGELPGHRVEVLLPQVVRDAHAGQRAGYFAGGAASRPAMVGKTLFGCRKDGSTFPVDVSLSRLPDLDGRRSAVCASVRDITERQAMEVARETALAEAQRLAQLRSAFMAQMSHELRTPLNGILGYTQNLLQGDALGEKQVAGLNIIQHSGEHLLSLINGLLDHAAIEANKFELIEGDIELDSFLTAIIGIIRIRAEQKNLAFTCEAGGNLPAVVRGDAQRLRQVLINLLANAVKFTDSGDVILRVNFVEPSRIRFEAQDSGVGIAADQLENIFLPFEQAGELQRRAGGSGLGLAISRTLVRLMGGDIRVESRPGAGSTFSFEIEIGIVESGRAGVDAAALSERAETHAAQVMPMLSVPPRQELDALHALALRGSMRDVTRHADKLAEADPRYQPFVVQLRRLAQSFQTKALLGLIEQYRNREQEE